MPSFSKIESIEKIRYTERSPFNIEIRQILYKPISLGSNRTTKMFHAQFL